MPKHHTTPITPTVITAHNSQLVYSIAQPFIKVNSFFKKIIQPVKKVEKFVEKFLLFA